MGQGHQKEKYSFDIGGGIKKTTGLHILSVLITWIIESTRAGRLTNFADSHTHVSHNIAGLLISRSVNLYILTKILTSSLYIIFPPCHTAAHGE